MPKSRLDELDLDVLRANGRISLVNLAAKSARWNAAVDALEAAIKVLMHPQEYGAVSLSFLPYVSMLPVFTALRAHAKSLQAARQLDARRKL